MPIAPEPDLVEVLESSPIGAVILDGSGTVLFWNSALLEILGGLDGSDFAAAVGQGFFYVHQEFVEACAALERGEDVRNRQVRVVRADGLEGWAAVSMNAITFGRQSATLVWYYDTTTMRLREQALERTQQTLLDVLDAAPLGAAICEGDGQVTFWNAALIEQLSDRHNEELSTTIRDGVALAAEKVVELGPGRPFQLSRPDGDERWITAWQSPIEFEGGPASLVWIHNVTDLRLAELTAERATRAKSAFLATMSHEIRTPMNGVRTIAELMFGTGLTVEQHQMVTTIKDSSDALVNILNDILDFSKVEAGLLEVEHRPFLLARVITGVMELLQLKAEEKGLQLVLRNDVPLDGWHMGDAMRLRQILLNLLGNAIKFTATGTVTLQIDTDATGMRFSVIDTGVGIAEHQVKELFAPFKQADASTARNYGGTGLGLSICKELVRLLDGHMGVETTLGAGSNFWFTLPLPSVSPDHMARDAYCSELYDKAWQAPDRQTAEQRRAVVLCAEDNKTNRDVLSRVLKRLGVVFDLVEDGEEALRKFDRRTHGLLLTDGHMPKLDGWALTQRMRAAEQEQALARLPVIALTADAIDGIERKCAAVGMDGYLTKPLNIAATDAMLTRWLPVLAELRRPDIIQTSPDSVPTADDGDIDMTTLIELVGPDPDIVDATLDELLTGMENLHREIKAGLAAGDDQLLLRSAHSLKSATLYVGAQRLSGIAEMIENLALQGEIGAVPPLLPQLKARIDAVTTAIHAFRARPVAGEPARLASSPLSASDPGEVERRLYAAATTISSHLCKLQDADAAAVQSAMDVIWAACMPATTAAENGSRTHGAV